MSSVTDKLLYLQQTKSLIKDAIENKEPNINLDNSTFREYVDAINSLVVGTGQLFAFELDENGNLICCTNYDGNISVPYYLDEEGNLIFDKDNDDIGLYQIINEMLEVEF